VLSTGQGTKGLTREKKIEEIMVPNHGVNLFPVEALTWRLWAPRLGGERRLGFVTADSWKILGSLLNKTSNNVKCPALISPARTLMHGNHKGNVAQQQSSRIRRLG